MIVSAARFDTALEPVLRDLAAAHPRLVRRGAEPADRDTNAWFWDRAGSGVGVALEEALDGIDAIVSVADQVQEFVVEALWTSGAPAVWPECPWHADSHPLRPGRLADEAVWQCPSTEARVGPVGGLATS